MGRGLCLHRYLPPPLALLLLPRGRRVGANGVVERHSRMCGGGRDTPPCVGGRCVDVDTETGSGFRAEPQIPPCGTPPLCPDTNLRGEKKRSLCRAVYPLSFSLFLSVTRSLPLGSARVLEGSCFILVRPLCKIEIFASRRRIDYSNL